MQKLSIVILSRNVLVSNKLMIVKQTNDRRLFKSLNWMDTGQSVLSFDVSSVFISVQILSHSFVSCISPRSQSRYVGTRNIHTPTSLPRNFRRFSISSLCDLSSAQVFFKKMGQLRPLFVYFRPFLISISIIQIEKSLECMLGI